ncbi:MAG TPA: aldehyde dehydrogenase [Holophagaceae bacterium]|nr:aldehyde dehydrogenase [Holophagaceae bacterium]
MTQPRTLPHFIAGRFQDPASGLWLEDLAPATGQVIAKVARGSAEDVDAAVLAAAAAQPSWGRSSVAERADLLEALAARVEARFDDFAEAESQDAGKPLQLARTLDIPRALSNLRHFAREVRQRNDEAYHVEDGFHYVHRTPVGVCALITPWNLPLYLLTWKLAPALAMGNTVVAKPSELTPLTAHLLMEELHALRAPHGIVNLVHGLGPEAGAPLVAHPRVKAVSFTGGTASGALVAAAAAPAFKKLSLELGGKNPSLVFADSDFAKAVQGVTRAAFQNTGQICLCGSRILVERSIHDRFVEALVKEAAAWAPGDPRRESTKGGALISAGHRDKVEGYLRLAVEEGGTIRCGGKRPSMDPEFEGGFFLEPTIITGLPATCRTATEEIFGPVVTVHPFDTEDEALAMANGVRYGLAANLWTEDLNRAHRVAKKLETGLVWINTWLMRDLRVPFGGVKDSGVGREGGRWSLEFFSEAKTITVKLD